MTVNHNTGFPILNKLLRKLKRYTSLKKAPHGHKMLWKMDCEKNVALKITALNFTLKTEKKRTGRKDRVGLHDDSDKS